LIRLGIRGFNPKLKKAAGRTGRLRTAPLATFDGLDRLTDRALQEPQAAANNHLCVPVALPLVIEFLPVVGIGITGCEFAVGFWLGIEQRPVRQWDRCS